MSTNSNQGFCSKMLLAGVAGASAVSVQTVSLVWANNILKNQKQNGLNLFESAVRIYQKGGVKSLFKGAFSTFLYSSLARFGDTATNFLVLNFFRNSKVPSETPLFLQSFFSWGLASLWRIAITPIGLIANPQNIRGFGKMNPKYRMARIFSKQVKPEIMSLYSWFVVQNYLTEYTETNKYSQNGLGAFMRYGAIGFLSMISYDCYKKMKQTVWPPELPSRFWFNRVFFRGLHGVIFCTTSHFIKEKLEQ